MPSHSESGRPAMRRRPAYTLVAVAAVVISLACGCGGGSSAPPPSPVPNISVVVFPPSTTVQAGDTQLFTAAVTGTSQTAVDWSVNVVLGGNNTVGTITPSGLYGEFTTTLVILTRCPAFLPRQFQSFARTFRVPDCGPSEGVRGVPECMSKERRPSGARHHNLARERRNPAKHPLGPSPHFGLRRRKAGSIPPERCPAPTSNRSSYSPLSLAPHRPMYLPSPR